MRALIILSVCALIGFAQEMHDPRIVPVATDPTDEACTPSEGKIKQYQGKLYLCSQDNTMQVATGGGGGEGFGLGFGLHETGGNAAVSTAIFATHSSVSSADATHFVSTNTGSAYEGCPLQAPSALSTGMAMLWKINANASGSVTLDLCELGAKKVYTSGGSTQAGASDVTTATGSIWITYDEALDSAAGGWRIVGGSSSSSSSSSLVVENWPIFHNVSGFGWGAGWHQSDTVAVVGDSVTGSNTPRHAHARFPNTGGNIQRSFMLPPGSSTTVTVRGVVALDGGTTGTAGFRFRGKCMQDGDNSPNAPGDFWSGVTTYYTATIPNSAHPNKVHHFEVEVPMVSCAAGRLGYIDFDRDPDDTYAGSLRLYFAQGIFALN